MHQMFSGVMAADYLVLSVGPMLEPESFSAARKVFQDIHSESDTEIVNPSQLQRLLLQTALSEMAGVLLPCIEKELEENRLVQPKRLNTPHPDDLPTLMAYLWQVTLQKWPLEGNRPPGPYLIRLREALQGSWVRRCPLEACEEASGVFCYVGSQQEAMQKMPSPAMVRGALEGAAQILRAFKADGDCLASSNRLAKLCRDTDGNCSSGIAEITVSLLLLPWLFFCVFLSPLRLLLDLVGFSLNLFKLQQVDSDACNNPGSASISIRSSCHSSKFGKAVSSLPAHFLLSR